MVNEAKYSPRNTFNTLLLHRWYWQGKPENVGQMNDCCSRRPMGLHKYKQKEQIEQLEQHFYGPSDNNEIKRLDERTRTYVNKVRNVMGIAV